MPRALIAGRLCTSSAVLKSIVRAGTLSTNRLSTASCKPRVWPGLANWRKKGLDTRWHFGENGPEKPEGDEEEFKINNLKSLAECGTLVLSTPEPSEKAKLTHAICNAYMRREVNGIGRGFAPDKPARPIKPILVAPIDMPKFECCNLPKPVYMLHNLAHIELNAIDLAWDTIFYLDFAMVAHDESRHFGWCQQRLKELGYSYGDMEAHNILWKTAEMTTSDINSRLALVPMCQEARGLDAGPRLSHRLLALKDERSSKIVRQIALEEKAHVAVGLEWFLKLSELMACNPGPVFRGWVKSLCPDLLTGRFDHRSRAEVGLVKDWYDESAWPNAVDKNGKEEILCDAKKLEGLRQRLLEVLDVELTNTK